ncbi:hypothetical protein ABZ912_19995 [Nonomuraea angiospora]|uniref:hypothetical protein n=1 Tax=Nonomuraea angiospora TaxID=46172 RepID=UPI0033F93DA4
MSLDATGILDAIVSHAMTLGVFETVNAHEVVNAPGYGLHAEVWADSIAPVAIVSGLAATSALVVWNVRIRGNADAQPRDLVDPNMMAAVDALMNAYSGDFTLDGLVRNVDLLGQAGAALSARAGYLSQGGVVYRIYDVVLPLIVSDVWEQVP